MLSRLVEAMIIAVGHCAGHLGQGVRNLLRPARTVAALAGAAGLDAVRPRSVLVAENALLRQQVLMLRRAAPRPRLHREDRLILVLLASVNSAWRNALHLVQPERLLRWHRGLFARVWRRTSRGAARRLRSDVIALIRAMATANRLWGAERIRGELLKLGTA